MGGLYLKAYLFLHPCHGCLELDRRCSVLNKMVNDLNDAVKKHQDEIKELKTSLAQVLSVAMSAQTRGTEAKSKLDELTSCVSNLLIASARRQPPNNNLVPNNQFYAPRNFE
ncbi:hypothetical protein ACOME3_002560 [Neoechinorhynchus agilis]